MVIFDVNSYSDVDVSLWSQDTQGRMDESQLDCCRLLQIFSQLAWILFLWIFDPTLWIKAFSHKLHKKAESQLTGAAWWIHQFQPVPCPGAARAQHRPGQTRQGKYRNWDRAPSSHSCIVSQYRSLRKMDAAACAEKFPQSQMGTEGWPELWGSPDTAWLVNETGQRHKHTKLGWHDALGQIAKVLWLWSLFSPALVLDHPGKYE